MVDLKPKGHGVKAGLPPTQSRALHNIMMELPTQIWDSWGSGPGRTPKLHSEGGGGGGGTLHVNGGGQNIAVNAQITLRFST